MGKFPMKALTIRLRQEESGRWGAYCIEEHEAYENDCVMCWDENPSAAARCVLSDDRLRERFGIALEE